MVKKVYLFFVSRRRTKNFYFDFLKEILKAIKYDLEQDTLTYFLDIFDKFSVISKDLNDEIKEIILFGIEPTQLGLNFKAQLYRPFEHNGIQFLFTDKLSKIKENKQLKSALWKSLQEIFINGK